jgi:formamidopyrimidine-DNA glycosylase
MPELPEVETFRRILEERALCRRILEGVTPARLSRRLEGRAFTAARRHGKQAFLAIAGGGAVGIHFGMSGRPVPLGPGEPEPPHSRVVFHFADDTALAFRCPRMFGRIRLLDGAEQFITSRGLGPDALAADLPTFKRALGARKGAVKATLLNQSVLAGIGNVYADEVLFQTGIAPRTPGERLTTADHRNLHRALQRIFRTSLKLGTDWSMVPRSWLIPHRERDGACPRCHGSLTRATVAGRTTFWCDSCQPHRSENLYSGAASR